MIYLCNTYSLQMLPRLQVGQWRSVKITRLAAVEAAAMLRENDFKSSFGHGWSAWHLSRYLKLSIPVERSEVHLTEKDILIVASVVNKKRCAEGVEGYPKWIFYRVEIQPRWRKERIKNHGKSNRYCDDAGLQRSSLVCR